MVLEKKTQVTLTDLGSQLLNAVFLKLGPSPRDVGALPFVCRAWRHVMNRATWKALCLEAAPSFCSGVGYGEGSNPPGKWGWVGVYKLITYCPGLKIAVPYEPENFYDYKDARELKSTDDLSGFVGHVETHSVLGFLSGKGPKKDLRLKASCRKDAIFITKPCDHTDEQDDVSLGYPYGCRGLVMDFATSAIARKSGAAAYLGSPTQAESEERSGSSNGREACTYCDGKLFDLPADEFFDNDWHEGDYAEERYLPGEERSDNDFDEYGKDPGYHTFGSVCEHGHLILQVFGSVLYGGGFENEMEGSGEDLRIRASNATRTLCKDFASVLQEDFERDRRGLAAGLDIVSVGERMRAVVEAVEERLSTEVGVNTRSKLAVLKNKLDGLPMDCADWFQKYYQKVALVIGDFEPDAREKVKKHMIKDVLTSDQVVKVIEDQVAKLATRISEKKEGNRRTR